MLKQKMTLRAFAQENKELSKKSMNLVLGGDHSVEGPIVLKYSTASQNGGDTDCKDIYTGVEVTN